jgi:hypothetical protein
MDEIYVIKDWAGNILFHGREFKTFCGAWDFIYQQFPNAQDGDLDDYYVERKDV